MLNHVTIMGRLVKDPELRRTGSGVAVTSFTVAVDRDIASKDSGEREADFLECVAWRGAGEFVARNFFKGKMIVVDGRLQVRRWTDQNGSKRRTTEIVADNVYFGDSKRAEDSSNGYTQPENEAADYGLLDGEDAKLPF